MRKRETPPNTAPAHQELRKHPPLFVMLSANMSYRLCICRRGTMNPETERSSSYDSVENLLQAAASWIAEHAAHGRQRANRKVYFGQGKGRQGEGVCSREHHKGLAKQGADRP